MTLTLNQDVMSKQELSYEQFLETKRFTHQHTGFDAKVNSKYLFPFQNYTVSESVKAGKYGIFSGTGTGKTRMQLIWAKHVCGYTDKPVLILAPLAVAGQTIAEGEKIKVKVTRLTEKPIKGIYIINYDQLDNIEEWIPLFGGVALDEGSILKNNEGVYRNKLIDLFLRTQFKSVWTATPSPNDPMEIGNYAEFLDVMPRNEMLAMYFVHDGGETSKWRIKGHSKKIFWNWVSTWAKMFQKPSDIGFEQDGYDLPPLNLIEKQIITNKRDNGLLFNDVAVSATNFNAELRITKVERLSQVADVVNQKPNEDFVIWVKQNEEGNELEKLIPNSIQLSGSDSTEFKEKVVSWFTNNECICQLLKKKERSITSDTTINTEKDYTKNVQNGNEKEEIQIPNGMKKEKNIAENIMLKTKRGQNNTESLTPTNGIENGENFIAKMSTPETKPSIMQKNGKKKIPMEKSSKGLKDTALQLTNTTDFLKNNIINAQSVKPNQPLLNISRDCMLTTATKQGELGDCCASTATMLLENSKTTLNYSKTQSCTCGANKGGKKLISKLKILGLGINMQNCHNQIFASPDFSFELVFQGIRRSWRFGQDHAVNIWLVTTDTMTNVIKTLERKQKQFDEMQQEMTDAVNRNITKKHKMKREFEEYKTENFTLQLGDCVQLIKNVPDESIGISIFSPPFSDLYCYSDELEDMGNSKNYHEFLIAFNFLVKELFRVLWSGRNVVVHCMDLPIQKGKEGYIGLRDFSGMILRAFDEAGFIYHSRVTLWKNPVTEMQRTKALGLLHKQIKKDAAMSRVGIPDYLLVFRKPGEHLHPIKHQDKDQNEPNYLPVDLWQKYASPVWMDIDYGNTLNAREGREEQDEKHIAPLQLETINRSLHLWSNEGDTLLTPFAGIGSEVFEAIKLKRKGKGFELKKSYYDTAVQNCIAAEQQKAQKLLFV